MDTTITVIAQSGEFGFAPQYTKYVQGNPLSLLARGQVNFLANPSDADTLTIGGVAYRFKTATAAAGDIKIGATLNATLINLMAATTGSGLASAYYAGTKPLLTASAELGTHTVYLTSYLLGQAGNAIVLQQTGSGVAGRYTLSGSTLLGGQNGGEVKSGRGRIVFAAACLSTETIVVGTTTYTFAAGDDTGNNIDVTANTTALLQAADLYGKLLTNTAVTNVVLANQVISFDAAVTGAAGNTTVLTETVAAAGSLQITGSGTVVGGQDASVFDRSTLTWHKLRAREVNYDANNIEQTLPLEIGSNIEPLGAYKSGVVVGGGATVLPRLESDFGWLLLGGLGKCTTTVPQSGVGQHVFTFQAAESEVPWFAIRKMIPGRSTGQYVQAEGLVGFDNILAALRLTVPQSAPVEAQVQFVGRVPELDNHPEGWISNGYENGETVPISCNGSFSLPTIFSGSLPVTEVIVELANGTTGPREEMIVGSYFMDDIVNRTRVLTLRFMYKWYTPELYQRLFGNAAGATAWSPQPFLTKTAGGNYAFDLLLQSPKLIGATNQKYQLEIRGNTVFWEPAGPIVLQAGGIVMQQIMGTVLVPDSGSYCEFVLTNGNTTGYPMPVEP